MPMTGPGLSAAIKTQIQAEYGGLPFSDAQLQAFCDAIGNAVVLYIQVNATVLTTGVTTGPGTAPGTIT